MAGPAVMRGTSFRCRACRRTVMWLAISKGGRDVTPEHVGYRDALTYLIIGASGASQFQAGVLSEKRL